MFYKLPLSPFSFSPVFYCFPNIKTPLLTSHLHRSYHDASEPRMMLGPYSDHTQIISCIKSNVLCI